jgi:hypothetical protein
VYTVKELNGGGWVQGSGQLGLGRGLGTGMGTAIQLLYEVHTFQLIEDRKVYYPAERNMNLVSPNAKSKSNSNYEKTKGYSKRPE